MDKRYKWQNKQWVEIDIYEFYRGYELNKKKIISDENYCFFNNGKQHGFKKIHVNNVEDIFYIWNGMVLQ